MDATDILVPDADGEPEFTVLGVSSLHEEARVPEKKQDVQDDQEVITGIAFLKSNIRYNTANLQPTFDPWQHQPIHQSASSKQDSLVRELTKGAIQRPQWREQATLHNGVQNGSPIESTAYIQGSNTSAKQPLPDMSQRSAALLSALQSNAEQQASRSEHLNAPPGISRQYSAIPSEMPTTQPRVMSPPSTISPLAVLNGANIPQISPRLQNAPSNYSFSPDMHDVRSFGMIRQRSPQQTAHLLNQLTAPVKEQGTLSTVPNNMETRGEGRRLRVFQGMRGDAQNLENNLQPPSSKKPDSQTDMADYLNSMAVSPSFSIREPPRMQQANSHNVGAGSDMAGDTSKARWGNLQLLSHMIPNDRGGASVTTTPPGLVSTASSPKSSPYGPETPRFAGDMRFSPISLDTLMSSASNSKASTESNMMNLNHNEYNDNITFKPNNREIQSANEEAAQLQDRLRALIHKNKNVMFS
ncbi:hypothetical protein BC943DRAFT_71125 [Umbelopsis sp. AD052]|nr:hypothetical protein BC943DRAFT_71125 [Umbelopsis sp. AD052]